MTHLDLFSGIGGFAYAVDQVWNEEKNEHIFCDNNQFCQAVLHKHWPKARIVVDIRFITDATSLRCNSKPYQGKGICGDETRREVRSSDKPKIDLLTGGFPCQPFSQAGRRGGTSDDRYLWPEMLRVIQLTNPTWVIAENVRGLLTINEGMVFEQVCLDLEASGYEVQPLIIPAVSVNAPHRRDRVWFVANNKTDRLQRSGKTRDLKKKRTATQQQLTRQIKEWNQNWLEVAQRFCLLHDGLPFGLARCLTNDVTKYMMGFILTIREANYAKEIENRNKALSVLREAVTAASVSELFRRFYPLYETEVLRCPVHGKSYDEREGDEISLPDKSQKSKEEVLRKLREERELAYSSQGRELDKQCSCKFDDIVRELSSEIALAEWEDNAEEANNKVFNLWKESRGERFLHEPLPALNEVWRSITDKEVGSFRWHYYKRDNDRNPRLKALGNSIVPQVAIEIMKGIKHS